jgi:hypothetical protein
LKIINEMNICYNSKEKALLVLSKEDEEEGPRKLLKAAENKQRLKQFNVDLLKYNLLCREGDTHGADIIGQNKSLGHTSGKDRKLNSKFIQNFIVKKVDSMLKAGNLQDKINLYYSVNDNQKDVLASVLEYDNISKKKEEQLSQCNHIRLKYSIHIIFE